jgi:MFS family permease
VTSVRALWHHRDFRWLWLGQSLSAIGDQMIIIVIALFVVDQTGSARDLGIVLAAQTAPLVLLILIGGVWADRLPRQRIMIASDLARFVVQATVATLVFAGDVPIWLLATLAACFGAAEAFFRPAYTGLIPQTVPEELIQQAQALTLTSYNVAGFIGPALATLLALGAGFGWAYLFDAVTFLVSAALLLLVRARARGEAPTVERRSMRAELAEGFREVRSRAWVWVTLLTALVVVFVGVAPFFAVGAVVARDEYGSTGVFGWLEVAAGVGTIAGALFGLRWRPERPLAVGIMFVSIWPVPVGMFALGLPLWMVLPAMALNGAGLTLFLLLWETALAERIPPDALSRVSSYDWMVSLALLPVGYLLAGTLADRFDASAVLLIGCAVAALAGPAALLSRDLRSLRRIAPAGPAPAALTHAPER